MENLITRITVDVCAVTSVTDNVQSMGSSNTMVNNIVTTVASILYISFSPLLENDPMSNPLDNSPPDSRTLLLWSPPLSLSLFLQKDSLFPTAL